MTTTENSIALWAMTAFRVRTAARPEDHAGALLRWRLAAGQIDDREYVRRRPVIEPR